MIPLCLEWRSPVSVDFPALRVSLQKPIVRAIGRRANSSGNKLPGVLMGRESAFDRQDRSTVRM